VEHTTGQSKPDWQPVQQIPQLTGGTYQINYPAAPNNTPFYRVVSNPGDEGLFSKPR